MSFGISIEAVPYRPGCKVVPNPDKFRYCGAPSGEHTILDAPVCDECYLAVRLES